MFGYVQSPTADQLRDAEGYLTPSLSLYGYPWAECADLILRGYAQLWMSDEAAAVTRKDGDALEIWSAGGRLVNASDHYINVIEQAARDAGFKEMRLAGRKGWLRLLRKWGWVMREGDLVKELKDG